METPRSLAEMQEDFGRYLQGEPLTEELAQVRTGRQPATGVQSEGESEPIGEELSRADRFELRDTVRRRGWQVFLKLQQRAIQSHVESATTQSQDDPLADPGRLAQEWAYLKMYRRACAEMVALAEAEIQILTAAEEEERETFKRKQ